MPSTNSSSMPNVFDSSTWTTPSLPTLSSASAICSPIEASPAEMAATCAISPLPSTSRAWFLICSTVTPTALSMPRLRSIGFAPAATFFMPRLTIARARTVAVVVPSPATSFVLVATSLASWAPMFSHGSSSSISLAIVTPSLVIVGAPHFLSRTTLCPLGPRVSATASASLSTPASSALRASSLNFSSFAGMVPPSGCFEMQKGPVARALLERLWVFLLLVDDREDVARGEDEVVFPVELDLGAAVLGVDDLVPDLDVEGDTGAVLEATRAHGDDRALLGLLLGGVGDHDAGDGGLLLLAGLDHDPVLQRLQAALAHLLASLAVSGYLALPGGEC